MSVFHYYTCTQTSALLMSEMIKIYQEENSITDATLKRKWGAAIMTLKEGNVVRMNQSKFDKLMTCEALSAEYFQQHSEKQDIFDYRTIILCIQKIYKGVSRHYPSCQRRFASISSPWTSLSRKPDPVLNRNIGPYTIF